MITQLGKHISNFLFLNYIRLVLSIVTNLGFVGETIKFDKLCERQLFHK